MVLVVLEEKSVGKLEELCLIVLAMNTKGMDSLSAQKLVKSFCHKELTISAIYTIYKRSERKNLVTSWLGEKSKKRGGKRNVIFQLTSEGHDLISKNHEMRTHMWDFVHLNNSSDPDVVAIK